MGSFLLSNSEFSSGTAGFGTKRRDGREFEYTGTTNRGMRTTRLVVEKHIFFFSDKLFGCSRAIPVLVAERKSKLKKIKSGFDKGK